MSITIETLYGTFDEKALKIIKGGIAEVAVIYGAEELNKVKSKEIVDRMFEETKIPKAIFKKLAKYDYDKSMESDLARFNELEALSKTLEDIKA